MQQQSYKTFIYAALSCEAGPLIEHFRLKKDCAVKPFAVYGNDSLCLTVTGCGKTAMAAGIAYTQALFAPIDKPVMLNIGIAGHRDHAIGNLFLVDKIVDVDSQKSHYPPLVFVPPCATEGVQTATQPQLDYNQPYLCDMEASAFYETAARFTTGELIHCLKVVSDNPTAPAEMIQPARVSASIAAHLATIAAVLTRVGNLAEQISAPESPLLKPLLERHRFSANEKVQLQNQLSRWDVLTGGAELDLEKDGLRPENGKATLKRLAQMLDQVEFYL